MYSSQGVNPMERAGETVWRWTQRCENEKPTYPGLDKRQWAPRPIDDPHCANVNSHVAHLLHKEIVHVCTLPA
jgi:hypothetical protein